MDTPYRAADCLRLCAALQLQWSRWGNELAIGEFMRIAVLQDPSRATAIALCRLLFRSKTGEPLRPPSLGEPGFLGGTTSKDWPLEPIHLYRGVPFLIVNDWALAGLAEQANWYLAHCLLHGVWNETRYVVMEQVEIDAIAHDFVVNGPWKRSLTDAEESFLLAQTQLELDWKNRRLGA
jgi:hypothetical protein